MPEKQKDNDRLAKSQEDLAQKVTSLVKAFESIPLEKFQKLEPNLAKEIENLKAQHKTIAEQAERLAGLEPVLASTLEGAKKEREEAAKDRELAAKERQEAENAWAAVAELHSKLYPSIEKVIAAALAEQAEREKRDAAFDSWDSRLIKIEQNSGLAIEKFVEMGGAMSSGFELMGFAIKENNHLAVQINENVVGISGKLDGLTGEVRDGVDQLQSSVDRIGLISNRMMDFLTNVRDVVADSQIRIMEIGVDVAGINKETFRIGKIFHEKVKEELQKFTSIPDKVNQQVRDLTAVINKVKGVGEDFARQGKDFSRTVEARTDLFLTTINSLEDLYSSHASRLNTELEIQMSQFKTGIDRHSSEIIQSINDTFRQSEMFTFIGKVHEYKEQLDHAQTGLVALLKAIQEEEQSFSSEVKATSAAVKESLSANAKSIYQSVDGIERDVSVAKGEVDGLMKAIRAMTDRISATDANLNALIGSVNAIQQLSVQGSKIISAEYLEQIRSLLETSVRGIKDHISNEIAVQGENEVLNALTATDGDENNNKNDR